MANEKISYEDAVREIESILSEIEGGTLGVDKLAEKVERVTVLLKICRDRLYRTEQKIERILGEEKEEGTESQAQTRVPPSDVP